MYKAEGDKIYYIGDDEHELFITIHPTKDCTKTVEEQAAIIANLLNNGV